MKQLQKRANREYLFLGILVVLLFLLNSFDKGEFGLQAHKAIFLLNYVLCALFINYVLLPKFLYQKKVWIFSILVTLLVALVIIIEEFVLEQLFFADTRGRGFNLFMTLMDVLPPLAFLVGYKFSWDAIQKQNKIDTLNRMVAESELQFLNSQINPHFLFNNLNNLYAYALDNSPKTPEIILQLSSILRYMLYDCRDKSVLLYKEIDNLKDYVELSRLQLGDEGKVDFSVEGNPAQLQISPLILMVFVENAFKHSPASQLDDVQINISVKINEKTLYFYCENNYTKNSNTDNLDKGIGLKNVKGRLDISYPHKHKLNIETTNNWYKVFLKVELE